MLVAGIVLHMLDAPAHRRGAWCSLTSGGKSDPAGEQLRRTGAPSGQTTLTAGSCLAASAPTMHLQGAIARAATVTLSFLSVHSLWPPVPFVLPHAAAHAAYMLLPLQLCFCFCFGLCVCIGFC